VKFCIYSNNVLDNLGKGNSIEMGGTACGIQKAFKGEREFQSEVLNWIEKLCHIMLGQ
jgi:hypothetical protein